MTMLITLLLSLFLNEPATQPAAIVVAADGSGQFSSVQAAIDSVPAGATARYVIQIKAGTYNERVVITKEKPPLTLRGQDAARTIITSDRRAKEIDPNTGKETGTEATATCAFESNDLIVENLTLQNTYGPGSQAVAVKVTGDRVTFRRCRLLGYQDTLYIKAHNGRHWFDECYIEGAVDFIFGRSTAVFEDCEINSIGKGYITASSTEQDTPVGYVFYHCKLTARDDVPPATVYLGRPWRPYGAVVYYECEMGPHIRPEGWDNWRKAENEKTARFAEYKCTGPGADPTKRVSWAKQLSDAEAAQFQTDSVLRGNDNWNPRASNK
jgi:pectinesterase